SLFVLLLVLSIPVIQAQQTYHINGEELMLETAVEGPLTLLWQKENRDYRYFLKRDNEIVELKNTKEGSADREEYKEVLRRHTFNTLPVNRVKFNLKGLSNFFVNYNNQIEPREHTPVEFRLGFYGGVDNVVYSDPELTVDGVTYLPYNELHPKLGAEFEMIDSKRLRHSAAFQMEYLMNTTNHGYTSFEISINYRFRFIKTPKFSSYVNVKLANFKTSTAEHLSSVTGGDEPVYHFTKTSTTGISSPVLFGLGAEYNTGGFGYITFGYNDIVGLNATSNKEFPLNFTLGYKFIL
ncbi:MAG: hypothetical protein GX163_12745, partial [Bacteroidetes bacterium]|nr:hypothetical protein [Bacteroidota bacterium]